MSIRPIDNSVLLTKTQEMSNVKQGEISKGKNITHNNFVKREKNVIQNQQKVIETKQTKYNKIGQEESNGGSQYSRNKKEKEDSEEKDNNTKETKSKGMSVDIRI